MDGGNIFLYLVRLLALSGISFPLCWLGILFLLFSVNFLGESTSVLAWASAAAMLWPLLLELSKRVKKKNLNLILTLSAVKVGITLLIWLSDFMYVTKMNWASCGLAHNECPGPEGLVGAFRRLMVDLIIEKPLDSLFKLIFLFLLGVPLALVAANGINGTLRGPFMLLNLSRDRNKNLLKKSDNQLRDTDAAE